MSNWAFLFATAFTAFSLAGCSCADRSFSHDALTASPLASLNSPSPKTTRVKHNQTTPRLFAVAPTADFSLRMQSPDLGGSDSAGMYFGSEDLLPQKSNAQLKIRVPDLGIRESLAGFTKNSINDHKNFYSTRNLPAALTFLGTGAVLANSQYDQNILEHIQDNITFNRRTNEYQEFVGEFRFFGEGYFLLPIYAGTAILGKHVFADNPKAELAGEWGDRCVRSFVLGAPPLIFGQLAIGASRPGESPETGVGEASEWQFFEDNNGISGHAFMGAIPFLTAYRMTDNKKLKALYFAASTLPALSRITENGHYPSQALLGWGLAYMATSSVARTETSRYEVAPYLSESGLGLGVTYRR